MNAPGEDNNADKKQSETPPAENANPPATGEPVADALAAAEKDIAEDADLSIHSPNDDLDEGELARLGEDKNDLA